MYWRIGNEYRKRSRDLNKKAFCQLVQNGPPPGLLAFKGDLAVGVAEAITEDVMAAESAVVVVHRGDDGQGHYHRVALAGAALYDGAIASLDDPCEAYAPRLRAQATTKP